jgi:hypothetical protein
MKKTQQLMEVEGLLSRALADCNGHIRDKSSPARPPAHTLSIPSSAAMREAAFASAAQSARPLRAPWATNAV